MFQSPTDTLRFWTRWTARAGLVAFALWAALALGQDPLARKVHVDIPAEPLASALIQLSAQAGVQVAAANEDVSNVQTGGVKGGDYSVEEAIQLLLHNTGLSFSPVGNGTVAIRRAPKLAGQSDVNVINPSPIPPGEALDINLHDFIRHHGSTYTSETDAYASPVRWRGARAETICPVTIGLDPAYNDFVSARIRAVAAYVGAPVTAQARCAPNLEVIFTADPRKPMEKVLSKSQIQGVNVNGLRPFSDTLDNSGQHAIQGWWRIVDSPAIVNTDPNLIGGGQLRGMWQRVIPTSVGSTRVGTHLKGEIGGLGFISVVLVINTPKVAGINMGAISDYLAFLSLSIAQNPAHCDQLPSILDIMAANCSQRPGPTTLTAADVAFLKAIYSRQSPDVQTPFEEEIEIRMRQQLTEQR